jgi:hypothetical protein
VPELPAWIFHGAMPWLRAARPFASSARRCKGIGPTGATRLTVSSLKLPCYTRAVKYLTNEAAGANPQASAAVITV